MNGRRFYTFLISHAVVLLWAVLFFPVNILAADAQQVVARLQKNYEGISSLSADFSQETRYVSLRQRRSTEGKVYFKKPGKMRWKYTAPSPEEIITNGIKLWLYDPGIIQVIEITPDKGPALVAMNFLSGTGDLKRDFVAELIEEKEDTYTIGLSPRTAETGIERLTAVVDKKRLLVVKAVVLDTQGVETAVVFKTIEVNPEIEDGFFEFKVPRGVRIIRP